MTEIQISDDFDLDKLAESGQCFCWRRAAEGGYRIVHRDRCLTIRQVGEDRCRLSCSEAEFERVWRVYFDLDTDYRAIRRAVRETEDPFLALAFAAGAMLYVVVEELIPEMSAGEHSNVGVVCFAVGFSLMMALDVALG